MKRTDTALAAGDGEIAHVQPQSRLPRWLWWMCYSLAWTVTLALASVAALRIFHHDGNHLLTWLNAFTRYVYLPIYPCAIWALWNRRWGLAAASFVVIAGHATWMAPNFLRDRRFDLPPVASGSPADASPVVRIFFANVLATNVTFDALWKEIAEANPDVVVLAECSRLSQQSLRQSPLMAEYLHANGPLRSQHGEVAVYSKLPIKSERQNWAAGRIVQTVDIELGASTLRLIGLHAPRPMYPPDYDYFGYWDRILPLLTVEKGPIVVIGDFNATEHSRVYKQLQASGLRSAHDDRGRGYATTWPNGQFWLPPIRIDQAFLSPDVDCLAIAEGRGSASDHKPLILDVRIRSHSDARANGKPATPP